MGSSLVRSNCNFPPKFVRSTPGSGHLQRTTACPLRVISRHVRCKTSCPLYPRKRPRKRNSAKGHVCFTPESGHVRRNYGCPLWAGSRMSALHHWRTFRVAFVMSALAVSALFPTFSIAASISSVVLLRRSRQRRAKALVEMATRFRDGFGRDGVTMAVLRRSRTSHQTSLTSER